MTNQNKGYLEWGISFWIGVGLMSIINALKLTNGSPIRYGWVMFGISVILVIFYVIFYYKIKDKKMIKLYKSKGQIGWGIAFWIGMGVMSIINVWKIVYNQNAIRYSWIMFGISIIFIIICAILIKIKK